ncbi:MAG: hypothetical protein ACUVS3_07980 [Thermodesulfobacteriota bacterium]
MKGRPEEVDLKRLSDLVCAIEDATRKLLGEAQGIQAIERNCSRILACVRMLRLNVCDALAGEQERV